MRPFILLAALAACTPLTEAERDDRAYAWQEHVIAWEIWKEACLDKGGFIYWKQHRACPRRECTPKTYEWRHWYDEDGRLRWQSTSIFCSGRR